MPNSKRSLAIVGALLVIGAGAAVYVLQYVIGPHVTVILPRRREVVQRVTSEGKVLPPAEVTVASVAPGKVLRVAVKEGDHVKAGDVLVEIDDTDAKAAIARTRAAIEQARAKVDESSKETSEQAVAAGKKAEEELRRQELQFARLVLQVRMGSAAPSLLDESKRALDAARMQHAEAEAQLAGTRRENVERRMALQALQEAITAEASAEVLLEQTKLVAPSAAKVLKRDVEPGAGVLPGKMLLLLGNDGATQVMTSVTGKLAQPLRTGRPARVTLEGATTQAFDAFVSAVVAGDPRRGGLDVKLLVTAPTEALKPDTKVSVQIEVGRKASALALPLSAVRDADTSPWLLVADGETAVKRNVLLGLRDEQLVEIVGGIGDMTRVISPQAGGSIGPGRKVRPVLDEMR